LPELGEAGACGVPLRFGIPACGLGLPGLLAGEVAFGGRAGRLLAGGVALAALLGQLVARPGEILGQPVPVALSGPGCLGGVAGLLAGGVGDGLAVSGLGVSVRTTP